jgi:hypothetical protein
MNDLDAFRETLQRPGIADDRAIDIGQIMKQGGRLRRRRRLATGGIGVATALVLVVGGAQLNRSFGQPDPGAPVAAGPGVSAAPSAPPGGATVPNPAPEGGGDRTPLGGVIATGLTAVGGTVVLYMVRVEEPRLPGTTIGVMAGIRDAAGELTDRILANETEGSDREPGFHAVQAAMNVEGDDFPLFGYYIGPAKKIVSGKLVAKQQAWSEDPSVIVFWFDPSKTPDGFKAKALTAYDRAGDRLPTGNRSVGVG